MNLRPVSAGGIAAIRPAESLTAAFSRPLVPLASAILPSGAEAVIFRSPAPDSAGQWSLHAAAGGEITQVWSGTDEPFCAVAASRGWIVMTAGGRMDVRAKDPDGIQWEVSGSGFRRPEIVISAVERGTVSETIAARTLSGVDFSRENPDIGDKNLDALSDALLEAYASLSARAAGSRSWIQPVIVRVHLMEGAERLYSTEPFLVAPYGWQCCEPISATCTRTDTSLSVPQTSLTAGMFSISVSLRSLGAYASRTTSVAVTVTPQVHPVDFGAQAYWRIARPSSQEPVLTLALPGATESMASRDPARAAELMAVTARLDRLETGAASMKALPDTAVTVNNDSRRQAAAERAEVDRALKAAVTARGATAADSLLASVSAPNSFIARRAVCSGDAVAWADITPVTAPAPLPPGPFTPGGRDTEWSGTLRVTLADGSTVDTLIGYPMEMPSGLPALTSYPDPEAVKMELWVENLDEGTVGYAAAALTPSADNRRAIRVDPSLKPVALAEWNGDSYPSAVNAGTVYGTRRPGAVLSARTDAPWLPLGALMVTNAPLVALHAAVKSPSSWDFTRCHLYGFSPAGIFAISLGADRSRISSAMIAPHSVTDGAMAAYTPAGVMALDSCGNLLCVSGSRIRTITSCPDATAIARSPATDELWIARADGSLTAIDPATALRRSLRFGSAARSIATAGNTLWLASDSATFLVSPDAAPLTAVSWCARTALKRRRYTAVTGLKVRLSASRFCGRIVLRGDSGAGTAGAATLITLDVDGEVNAPLSARLAAPARSYISLEITGEASPDLLIDSSSIFITE